MKQSSHTGSLALVLALSLAGCMAPPGGGSGTADSGPLVPEVRADLAISRAPFHDVDVNWKQRLDQAYVFIEAKGSYTQVGGLLERVDALMEAQGIDPAGPPFGLFYDDPGKKPVEELRMRACFPVLGSPKLSKPLSYSALESTTVVYAFIGGPYPEVPRAFPGMFEFMRKLNWVEDGPIRETYLVNPALVSDFEQLVCEVQIPAASAP